MAGYSGTPLAKKLGLKPGCTLHLVNAPAHFRALLEPIPQDVQFVANPRSPVDIIHFFSSDRAELEATLPLRLRQINQDGTLWVSWPKKASGIQSTITEDVVREIALPLGLVDTKVCAIDETWSGLKLVIRRENRKPLAPSVTRRPR